MGIKITPSALPEPRSPDLQNVMLSELAKFKAPMSKERDALQRIIDNDEATVRAGRQITPYQIPNLDPLSIFQWAHVCSSQVPCLIFLGWK